MTSKTVIGLSVATVLLGIAQAEAKTQVVSNKKVLELHWTAPTANVDGSPLTDLAGYNIYTNGLLAQSVGSEATSVSPFKVEPNSTTVVTVTAFDENGNESVHSEGLTLIEDSTSPNAPTEVVVIINGDSFSISIKGEKRKNDKR